MNKKIKYNREEGALLATVIIVIMFLSIIIFAIINLAQNNMWRAEARMYTLQTQYAAESGIDIAIARLNGEETQVSTEQTMVENDRYRATYEVTVEDVPDNEDEKIVTSKGRLYTPKMSTEAKYYRTVRVMARRSSTNASSSMLSQDAIHIASSMKGIVGKSIYVNKFIKMDKDNNQLLAEKITVAGTVDGPSNCSLVGSKSSAGTLLRPVGYTDKVELKMRGINCVVMPNEDDFDVTENDLSLVKIHSTKIPWQWAMNDLYVNADSCSDWGGGSGVYSIPANPTSKRSHYPDSSSGVDGDCGDDGTLNLGSGTYNIMTDVHIRANLCDYTMRNSCKPTFNNPDTSNTRYIFIEGNVAFPAFYTSPGSGPMVFVVYGGGTKEKEITDVCTYPTSIYLGPGGSETIDAPQAYLLAANSGFCAYQVKFAGSDALGGISAKNIYMNTNSGNPYALQINSSFPLDAVPVNLSWRATEYTRIF